MPPSKKVRRNASPLEQIPGVGPSIAADLHDIGIDAVAELKGADPQALYDRVCRHTGEKQDRCLLYVFRCAVYYSESGGRKRDPEKLKWWNWTNPIFRIHSSKTYLRNAHHRWPCHTPDRCLSGAQTDRPC